jgi:hypothetical protein
MNRTNRLVRLLVASVLAAATLAGPVASAVHAGPAAPQVPPEIEPEAGHKVFLVGHAAGVQIYACNASGGDFGWAFVAPRADLYDSRGKLVATHFGGPTWQARDGSKVVAERVDGVSVDPSAIPWLLLSTVSAVAGPDGDRLAGTTFIQRTATTGGLAPDAAGCHAGTVGTTAEVPYTADYHFWKATGA